MMSRSFEEEIRGDKGKGKRGQHDCRRISLLHTVRHGHNSVVKQPLKKKSKQALTKTLAEIREQFSKPRPKKRQRRKRAYNYEISLISYLDVLGMKDLLEQAGRDANNVAEVLERFRDFSKPVEDQKELWRSTFVNFSDLGLRIHPVHSDANVKYRIGGFFQEVMDLGFIQVNLINRGSLVRGGLALGFICHSGGLVFGPGLAEAYELESKVAKYPRIVVDDFVMEALKQAPVLRAEGNTFNEEMSYLKNVLRRDADGVWFIDYIEFIRSEGDGPKEFAAFLQRHKHLIEKQRQEVAALPRGNYRKSRLEKLKWLIQLHRSHIAQLDPTELYEQTGVRLSSLRVRLWH
jgi:hypothetical protein